MSDIVERLRLSACGNCRDALPEFEALRAEVERLKAIIIALETDCPDCESAHEARIRAVKAAD
jgi:hypothetical protein